MELKALGVLLKNYRLERKMGLKVTADLAEISHPYLSDIEKGKIKNAPSDEVLIGIIQALNLNEEEEKDVYRMVNLSRTPEPIREELFRYESLFSKIKKRFKDIKEILELLEENSF